MRHGGCRHLEYKKTVAISVLFYQSAQSSSNLVGLLRILCRVHLSCQQIAWLSEFKMAAAAILNFEKQLSIHYYLTNPRQIWWDWCDSDVERIFQVEKRSD